MNDVFGSPFNCEDKDVCPDTEAIPIPFVPYGMPLPLAPMVAPSDIGEVYNLLSTMDYAIGEVEKTVSKPVESTLDSAVSVLLQLEASVITVLHPIFYGANRLLKRIENNVWKRFKDTVSDSISFALTNGLIETLPDELPETDTDLPTFDPAHYYYAPTPEIPQTPEDFSLSDSTAAGYVSDISATETDSTVGYKYPWDGTGARRDSEAGLSPGIGSEAFPRSTQETFPMVERDTERGNGTATTREDGRQTTTITQPPVKPESVVAEPSECCPVVVNAPPVNVTVEPSQIQSVAVKDLPPELQTEPHEYNGFLAQWFGKARKMNELNPFWDWK